MAQFGPNDLKTFRIQANGVDISSMVLAVDIFQELFNPSWSSQIAFIDTQNMLMNIPINPGTEISITLETDYPNNESKTFRFVVYKISDRVMIGQDQIGYFLNCVSKEFFSNQKKRVSKAFKNMTPGDIVSTILNDNSLGSLENVDVDAQRYTTIIPNMSPFAAINSIVRFTTRDAADYWFYQVDDAKFELKSYNEMLVNRSGVEFKQLNPNLLDDSNKNVPEDHFFNIESFEFVQHHDSMSNYAAGYYGSKILKHDIHTKSFSEHVYNYGDDIPSDKSYAPFNTAQFSGAQDSHITFAPMNSGLFGENITTPSDTSEDWIQSRKSNVMKLEENRLVATVPGVVGHYKLLGKQVNVQLPSYQDIDESELLDKYLKGSYVVTAIRHVISSDSYKIILEMGKKRLESRLD